MYLGAINHLSEFCTKYCVACNNTVELIMLEEYAAVNPQHKTQAYECYSSRVLLECRWKLLLLLLLLSARVPVTAWPRRARVCLVLVALEQSSDCGPVSFFLRYHRPCLES